MRIARPTRLISLIATAWLLITSPTWAQSPLQAQLVSESKALLDAVARGDRATWIRILAERGLFTDEEGKVRSKAQVVAEIRALPTDIVGSMAIENPRLARSGDVAVLTYEAIETEAIFGQTLRSQYHQTDTYHHVAGRWLLLASQVSILPAEAAPVGPPARLNDFQGVYRLGTNRLLVTAESGTLFTERDGRKGMLVPLGGDHFARRGRPRGERIFFRNAEGVVTGFVDRRDNEDLRWAKD